MDFNRKYSIYQEEATAIKRHPFATPNCATTSALEDIFPDPFNQDTAPFIGTNQANVVQEYGGSLYSIVEHPASTGEASSPAYYSYQGIRTRAHVNITHPSIDNGRYDYSGIYPAQHVDIGTSSLCSDELIQGYAQFDILKDASSVQTPDLQLQRDFLRFLMDNHELLSSITYPTLESMATLQYSFAQDIQRCGPSAPLTDIEKIFQQFKPVVGSDAIHQESNNRTVQAIKIECPFGFCGSYFTRLAGLKSKDGNVDWIRTHAFVFVLQTIFRRTFAWPHTSVLAAGDTILMPPSNDTTEAVGKAASTFER